MVDRRLVREVPGSLKFVGISVLWQWIGLFFNIVMMKEITVVLSLMAMGHADDVDVRRLVVVVLAALLVRGLSSCVVAEVRGHLSSFVKNTFRSRIYEKLLRLGRGASGFAGSEVVQVAVEGVDQLETYFDSYLPQLFYAVLAPVTLFAVLASVDVYSALLLFVCVPLIPVSIAVVQTFAKRLLGRYWNQYSALADTFLENLQGLVTLKIYQADEDRQRRMNEEAEKFRVVTMKVLRMQLNSITIMDLVAYGGSALGGVLAVCAYRSGRVDLAGCLLVVLLSADFFLPMRRLGSYFHIAMNGMAASVKMFRFLDLAEGEDGTCDFEEGDLDVLDLSYAYPDGREVLHGLSFSMKSPGLLAVVGASGSGKSTWMSLLMGKDMSYTGSLRIGDREYREIKKDSLLKSVTYVGAESAFFKGSVRMNLLVAKPNAKDCELWAVLKRVHLLDFFEAQQGLETNLLEGGRNLSGGQRQRLALARALLKDSRVVLFDECTSNVDGESEAMIMEEIKALAKSRLVVLVSHRLKNVVEADSICVLEQGVLKEQGVHEELLEHGGVYADMWNRQRELEVYAE